MLSKLLLTAAVSLAVGAGGTYATIHVTATCDMAQVQSTPPLQPSHFFDAPAPPPTGGPRY
jgi:hypothetical protein